MFRALVLLLVKIETGRGRVMLFVRVRRCGQRDVIKVESKMAETKLREKRRRRVSHGSDRTLGHRGHLMLADHLALASLYF